MPRECMVRDRVCKVRKRGCSSSSSSSSILKNHRLKRAILIGRRRASSTPFPTWKMTSSSPSPMVFAESPRSQNVAQKAKQGTVSARKLAATLWEMNEIPHAPQHREVNVDRKTKSDRASLSTRDHHLSDPSHSPVSDTTDQSGTGGRRRKGATVSHRHKCQGLDSSRNTSLMEVDIQSRGSTQAASFVKREKGTGHCSSNYKELLKILNRIWDLEEHHSSSMSLVSALRRELKRARVKIDRLVEEHTSGRHEIEYLTKRFAEEKSAWKGREQERIKAAVGAIGSELEIERRLRKRTESMNKKLGRELMETKGLLAKAMKELESERKVRQVMEEVCDELARGIGEYNAEVEGLKRESAKVWEEAEREREMLQLANVWREERVQMKLADAKFHLEEKNAALDKLRLELETFVKAEKTSSEEQECIVHAAIKEQQQSDHGDQSRDDNERDSGEHDSTNSDLHSIELNRDENSRSYKWSYTAGATTEEDGNDLILHDLERAKGTSLSFHAGNFTKCIEWDVGSDEKQENAITHQRRRSEARDSALYSSHIRKQDYDLEMQRYNYLKGLRHQAMAGSKIAPASPTRNWDQLWPSQEQGSVANGRSEATERDKGTRESGAKNWLVETKPEGLNLYE